MKHPDSDQWELYALGRLPESRVSVLEEHLLVCTFCQQELAECDAYVNALKEELTGALNQPGPVVSQGWPSRLNSVLRLAMPPRPALWAAATAVLVLGIALDMSVVRRGSSPPVSVVLESYRGGEGPSVVPSGSPLLLNVASSDVPLSAQYDFEIVNHRGKLQWHGPAAVQNGRISASAGKLDSGLYWVRLYDADHRLLREFSLSSH